MLVLRFICLLYLALNNVVCVEIGMNLEGKTYYSQGILWKNRLNEAMPFISQNSTSWGDPRPLNLDENGYVISLLDDQYAGSLFLDTNKDEKNQWNYQTQGLHTFFYSGDCSCCEFRFNAKILDASQDGQWLLNISDFGGTSAYLRITCINDTNNYPRDMKIIPNIYLSDYKTEPFDPLYVLPLSTDTNGISFNVLRFMDYLDTNNSPNQYWNKRTLTSNYTQANGYGVAWEYIFNLSSYLNTNPWINIPHLADDNYVTSLAKLIYNEIIEGDNSNIEKVYIEYSNECWNAQFECYSYCKDQSLNYNGEINNYQWYGMQVCHVHDLFEQVFTTDEERSRLYFVMGTQIVNPWITGQELMYNDVSKRNQSLCVDGVAVASYYCVYNMTDEQIVSSNIDELFDNIESQENREYHRSLMSSQLQESQSFEGRNGQPLPIIAYEGSWGCVAHYGDYYDNETQIYNQMVLDPRVGQTVYDHLMDWNTVTNGSLFNIFSFYGWSGQYGDWGHLQYQTSFQNISANGRYKYDGIMQYLAQF